MSEYENELHHGFMFRIIGSAEIQTSNTYDHLDAVIAFNEDADKIASEITQLLKGYLPPSVGAQTELRFDEGSVNWEGVVEVLDWVGRIVDTVGFVQIAVRVIQFASNRAIRKAARRRDIPLIFNTMQTAVMPNFSPQAPIDAQIRSLIARQDEQIRLLQGLTQSQTNLMRYFGQLQRINPAFRVQQPTSKRLLGIPIAANFKDALIVLILIVFTILQAINLFGLRIGF